MAQDNKGQHHISMSEYDNITRRLSALDTEYSSWETHLKEINRMMMPRTGRFIETDRNNGDQRRNNIIDSTGSQAINVLGAGMVSGASSPARPWIRLQTVDPTLQDSEAVQKWLHEYTRILLSVFHRSNTYRSLSQKYEECGTYGTAASLLMDDFDTVIHDYNMTIGEYRLGTNYRGEVDTIARRFQKQVGGLVKEFGYKNCSTHVRNLYDRGAYDAWITVVHIIQPREFYDASKFDNKNMPYQSVYYEEGQGYGTVLRNSGLKDFKAITPRWRVTPGNTYGEGQGMVALGDVSQLQHEQLRKGQVIDYQSNPPLQVPTSMKGRDLDRLPGGVSYYDAASGAGQGAIRNAFDVPLRMDYLLEDIQDVRQRINSAFFVDMFLMIANDRGGPQQTATEIAEKHEEKMLMLGPVLENLHHEELRPRVIMTAERVMELGLVPPPPPEMDGAALEIEFVSILAQAQKAISINSTDRFVAGLGQVATIKPNVLDRLNEDEWAEEYADVLGVNPKLIVPSKQAALIREDRAAQQQAMQQQEQMAQTAQTAKTASDADTEGNNALTEIMRTLQG